MQRRLLVLLLFVSTTIAACASNSASSGGGAGGSSAAVVLNGCRVDPARICNAIRGQSVVMSGTGLEGDSRLVEQNSARTANITVPIRKPNGDPLFEVECGINTLHQSVSWAQVRTGPKITDDDAKYLRSADYCTEL